MERVWESQFELGDNSLNWSYLYDADVFFQFRVLIRVHELISIWNQPRIHLL